MAGQNSFLVGFLFPDHMDPELDKGLAMAYS